jgi:(2Fe-2S) ferredoxin
MEKSTYRAYLCFGPNCGPKGSGALLDFLTAQVANNGLENKVSVAATGCQAHCESGPTMVVFPGPTYYQQIDRDRLTRIVAEHFVDDRPVADYFWTGVRRRIIPGSKSPSRPLPMPVQDGNSNSSARQRPIEQRQRLQRPPKEVDDFKW